jgi:branched-chain amino acid transport system permease protein
MIALSLMFLGGYGGMVSLAQMTVAALAGYMVAILGTSGVDSISASAGRLVARRPVAIVIATLFGTATGALAVRTEGIYTIMITLAIAAAFFYFTRQNYTIFNGYSGFPSVCRRRLRRQLAPSRCRSTTSRSPARPSYLAVVYVSRSPFGLALQGIRDNPAPHGALGFNVVAHRIAAYAFASVIAAVGGILLVWQNAQISPGTAGIPAVIDILVIAIVGGLSRPIGPFIGASSTSSCAPSRPTSWKASACPASASRR